MMLANPTLLCLAGNTYEGMRIRSFSSASFPFEWGHHSSRSGSVRVPYPALTTLSSSWSGTRWSPPNISSFTASIPSRLPASVSSSGGPCGLVAGSGADGFVSVNWSSRNRAKW
jgi:hypothetical protein